MYSTGIHGLHSFPNKAYLIRKRRERDRERAGTGKGQEQGHHRQWQKEMYNKNMLAPFSNGRQGQPHYTTIPSHSSRGVVY